MSWPICMYLLKKSHKLIRGIFIPQYGLQKLKVSLDLEKLVYKVVETPWITPYMKFRMEVLKMTEWQSIY